MKQCEACEGSGRIAIGEHFVSHDMALDACEPAMEGASMGIEHGPCPSCGSSGLIQSNSTNEQLIDELTDMASQPLTVERLAPVLAKVIAALRPSEAPQRIPEGWVLVPKDMPRFSEVNFDEELFDLCRKDDYRGLYRALIRRALAAAPPSSDILESK